MVNYNFLNNNILFELLNCVGIDNLVWHGVIHILCHQRQKGEGSFHIGDIWSGFELTGILGLNPAPQPSKTTVLVEIWTLTDEITWLAASDDKGSWPWWRHQANYIQFYSSALHYIMHRSRLWTGQSDLFYNSIIIGSLPGHPGLRWRSPKKVQGFPYLLSNKVCVKINFTDDVIHIVVGHDDLWWQWEKGVIMVLKLMT